MSRNSLSGVKAAGEGYYYEDDFLYFTFNDKYSKEYNLFITSDGTDAIIASDSGASSSYDSPLMKNVAFYQGTNKAQRTFSYTMAAGGLTLPQYKEMMLWLEPGQKGFFVKDCDFGWGYNVVIDSIGEVSRYGDAYTFGVEFKITFKTIGIPYARPYTSFNATLFQKENNIIVKNNTIYIGDAAYTYEEGSDTIKLADDNWDHYSNSIMNDYGIPEIFVVDSTPTSTTFYLPQVCNKFQFIDLGFCRKASEAFTIITKVNNSQLFEIDMKKSGEETTWKYDGMSGMFIGENGFFDSTNHVDNISAINGIVSLPCEEPIEIIPSDTIVMVERELQVPIDSKTAANLYNTFDGTDYCIAATARNKTGELFANSAASGFTYHEPYEFYYAFDFRTAFPDNTVLLTIPIRYFPETLPNDIKVYICKCNKVVVDSPAYTEQGLVKSITVHKFSNL